MANFTWADYGSYLSNAQLSKEFRKAAQPLTRFRQFVTPQNEYGKNSGQTFNWLKVSNASSTGGRVGETNLPPEGDVPTSWGTGTVYQYMYSVPFSQMVEALSMFNVKQIIDGALLDDFRKVVDGLVEIEFRKSKLSYIGTSTTAGTLDTDGTPSSTNSSVLNSYHLGQMRVALQNRNVAPWDGSNYIFIGGPDCLEGLEDQLISTLQYTELGIQRLFKGEIGQWRGIRFVLDNQAASKNYSPTARTWTDVTWTNGKSSRGYMFGKQTVREGIVIPEEIRIKKDGSSYGLSKGCAWFSLFGHQIEWDTAADAKIVRWESDS